MKIQLKTANTFFILMLSILILNGCTPSVSQLSPNKSPDDLSRYEHLHVIIKADNLDVSSQYGYQKTIEVMHEKLMDTLSSSGQFDFNHNETNLSGTLELKMIINEFRYVSGASRSLNGISAGEAILGGDILIKAKEGNKLAEFSFLEKSGNEKWIFSDYTGKQLKKLANKLFAILTSA